MPSGRKSRKNISRSMRFLTSLTKGRNPFTDETKYQDKKLKKKYAKLILAKTRGVRLRDVKTPNTPAAKDIIEIDRGEKERKNAKEVEALIARTVDLVNLERKLSPTQLKEHKQRTAARRGGKSKRKSHKHRKTRKISSFFQIF